MIYVVHRVRKNQQEIDKIKCMKNYSQISLKKNLKIENIS